MLEEFRTLRCVDVKNNLFFLPLVGRHPRIDSATAVTGFREDSLSMKNLAKGDCKLPHLLRNYLSLGQAHSSSLRYHEERLKSPRLGVWATTFSLKVSSTPVPGLCGRCEPVAVGSFLYDDRMRVTPPSEDISTVNHSV